MKQFRQFLKRKRHRKEEQTPYDSLPNINVVQNITRNVGKAVGVVINLPDPDEKRLRLARANLLARVKAYWIEVEGASGSRQGALQAIENDLKRITGGAGLLQLRKRFEHNAVDFPISATRVAAHLDANRSEDADSIRPERASYDIFRGAQHSLLILGKPGAGKTVTLLEIAREAVREAETATEKPVPIILDLQTWANEERSIAEWVAAELNSIQYGVPREITQLWLRDHHLLLLLDGLNALEDLSRQRCTMRLRDFIRDYGFSGTAVCCREAVYASLESKLNLHDAIRIEPLVEDQLDAFFDAAGDKLAGLRIALRQNKVLKRQATTPLMLHIMSIAYEGVPFEAIPGARKETPEARHRKLFKLYVERMFRYGGEDDKPYSDQETVGWLAWLARQMEEHNRPIFLIEHMQPSWLPSSTWRLMYMVGSRLGVSLVVGFAGGIAIGMALAPSVGIDIALLRGVVEGVAAGILVGFVMGPLDMLWITHVRHRPRLRKLSHVTQTVIKIAATSLVVTLVVTFLFGLLFGYTGFLGYSVRDWLFEGSLVGMLAALSASLLFAFGSSGIRHDFRNDIQTVELVSWSRARAWRGGVLTAAVGLFAGALAGAISTSTPLVEPLMNRGASTLSVILIISLIGGAFLGLIGVVFGGFAGTFRKVEKVRPNEGLRLSLGNAISIGLRLGILFALVGVLLGLIIGGGERGAMIAYLFYGLFVGVLAAMWYGGIFIVQHAVLRLLLWKSGHTPPVGQYARLLDYAARRVLLYKVGGGYRFINRYLQKYFAGMSRPSAR